MALHVFIFLFNLHSFFKAWNNSICSLDVCLIYIDFVTYSTFVLSISAQITQWDLLFHGTEQPAQPNDPRVFNNPESEKSYVNEMGDNSLHIEPEMSWSKMQRVSFMYFVANESG